MTERTEREIEAVADALLADSGLPRPRDHRQEVYDAHLAVYRAEQARSRALADALNAGESTRSLAELLGKGHMTVWRWAQDGAPHAR